MPSLLDLECEWCGEVHKLGREWCPHYKNNMEAKSMLHKVSFMYTMPSGQDTWVYATATEVTTSYLEGLELSFFSLEGDPLDMLYSREVFEEVEDIAHEMIYYDEEGSVNEAEEGSGEAGTGARGTKDVSGDNKG
jgi:hypothetical protein